VVQSRHLVYFASALGITKQQQQRQCLWFVNPSWV